MLALTVRAPWASLIAQGIKTVESRSWSTDHRGWLAIHESSSRSDVATPEAWELAPASTPGCISCVVRVVDVVRDPGGQRWASLAHGDFHWLLADVQPIDPIACRGRLGLWVPPPDVVDRVLDAIVGASAVAVQ